MPFPRVEGRFEESWILGEERGIASTNEHGVHLRIVARATSVGGTGRSRSKGRKVGRRRQEKTSASASTSRQFDLFIDGRSYFDLPLLDESTGELVAEPIASASAVTSVSTCTGKSFDDSAASTKTGSYDQQLEREEEEEEGAEVEDWTANGSAIASNDNDKDDNDDDDDDDLDSVDGFMATIDLSGKPQDDNADPRIAGDKKSSKCKGSAVSASASASGEPRNTSARMASAKSHLQRSTARTAGKIGSSTKKGTKRLVAGMNNTSKVFLASPLAFVNKRTSATMEDEHEVNADGRAVEDEVVNGADPPPTDADAATAAASDKEEDSRRINHSKIASFSELHNTMMPSLSASTDAPTCNNAEEIIAQLREQIVHLEREIAHNADRVAAEVERSVAISEIEARMIRERDQDEIVRLQNDLNEMQKEATSQAKGFQEELELAKIEAEKLRDVVKAAEQKSNELQTEKETAEEEIVRLKERMLTLEKALARARRVKPPHRKGAPFVSNDQLTSYLDNQKCCLCCKDATENMRDCQCGKDTCGLQAHVSCLIGSNHHPTPSVSHPGTPSPALPLILCGGLFQK